MKYIWKNIASRIWLIVMPIVLVLVIVVTALASGKFFEPVNAFFQGETIKTVGDGKSQFTADFNGKEETLANGNKVTLDACREGFTLLKNEKRALPLTAGSKISVFGKNSVDVAIGGSGSGGSIGVSAKTIFDSLTASGFKYNTTLKEFYEDDARSGDGRDSNNSDLDTGSNIELKESFVGETPVSSYDSEIWNSCNDYKDAALIVITRIGGEGADLPRTANDHILKLRQNEKDLIAKVKTMGFGKVVLVLNTATTLELKEVEDDPDIDAILWVGYPGAEGMLALGEVLKGETSDGVKFSPSGKTVDTYAADFTKDPTWNNFGAALGSPASGISGDAYYTKEKRGYKETGAYFVDYEENIYVGYRYYETAYAESVAGNYPEFNYSEAVVYPFGYGLSYTTFSWELLNREEVENKILKSDTSITFKIKVTNTGTYPGKDVVQLYVTPPYTPGGIEKPAKMLVGFGKTKLLGEGDSDTVEITVDSPYAFASYDCYDLNKNGIKGYEVEKGTYTFSVSTDAHNAKSKDLVIDTSVQSDISYAKDPDTGTDVVNRYTDNSDDYYNSDTQLGSVLSRSNFVATWPASRTAEEKMIGDASSKYTEEFINAVLSTSPNPNRPSQSDVMPATGENNGILLSDMIGKDYDDEDIWNDFLDQLTVSEMTDLVNKAGFHTELIARLGVPRTLNSDGPVGWVNFMPGYKDYFKSCTTYCCEVVLSSTWNVDCLTAMGNALGNEGLIGNTENDGLPYTGWYAPGLNIHRSPFGGRNFEYYSEDPYLSGIMTGCVMKGAAEKGVYCDLKHFALNEQETHRASNGLLTWATEQSMREVYLKGFEIAIKECNDADVKLMGMMSSFNRIGTRWTGGDYRLLTDILREEWGFRGAVISDFNTCGHMVEKDMFYAGGDLNLQIANNEVWTPDASSASDVTVLRQATKNILYTVANSNAMRGDFIVVMPTWQIIMVVVDCVIVAGLAVWGFFVIRQAYRKKNLAEQAE